MATSSRKKATAAKQSAEAKLAKAEKLATASKKAAAEKKLAATKKALAEKQSNKDALKNKHIPSSVMVNKDKEGKDRFSDSSSSSDNEEEEDSIELRADPKVVEDSLSIETPENVVVNEKKIKKKKSNEGKEKKKKRKNKEEGSTGDNPKKSKTEASVLSERKVTTKVEESIVIRDKTRLDIYVRKLNNLHDEKIVMEEHYLKTINSLMNKYVAATKELKKFRLNQDQTTINDDQKVLHSEMLLFLGQVLARNSLKFEIMFPTHCVSIYC